MSDFPPPPPPGGGAMYANAPVYGAYQAPPPMSKAAVAGFVFSLSFCLFGVHAILGIIFGIIGISATSGGQRRGRGLAIAAIPISIVVGIFSTMMLLFSVMLVQAGTQVGEMAQRLEKVMIPASGDMTGAVTNLRAVASDAFNAKYSDAQLRNWVAAVARDYGAMRELDQNTPGPPPQTAGDTMRVSLPVKFVNKNGVLNIVFKITMEKMKVRLKIDDIDVSGLSPETAPASKE